MSLGIHPHFGVAYGHGGCMSVLTRIIKYGWILALLLALAPMDVSAGAQSRSKAPVPQDQLTPQTKLWLARAMVSEAGWLANLDHAGIAHILARRWHARRVRWPGVTFEQIIRYYCAGFYLKESSLTPRQLWVRQLIPADVEPPAWPRNKANWPRHYKWWKGVLQRVELFSQGRLRDPCRGQGWHWGGWMDEPEGRMEEMDCGETKNTFYTLVPKKQEEYASREGQSEGRDGR